MPVDNGIYDRPGDLWWDAGQPLNAIRTGLNPARLEYLGRVLAERGLDPRGSHIVDIGCGGGLLAEELAGLGAAVTGVDPSLPALAVARRHAAGSGVSIDYKVGAGEHLPLPDACADIACCVDVLEHVDDLDAVLAETARILTPGGLYVFDTINRTRLSRLVMIKVLQEWPVTACVPRDLHDWHRFITPAELHTALARHGLRPGGTVGLSPRLSPPRLVQLLWQLRRGKISYAQFGERGRLAISTDRRVSYAGHAVKDR